MFVRVCGVRRCAVCFLVFQATTKRGKETVHTAARFVLATGERPRYLGIPGDKEFCITRYAATPGAANHSSDAVHLRANQGRLCLHSVILDSLSLHCSVGTQNQKDKGVILKVVSAILGRHISTLI